MKWFRRRPISLGRRGENLAARYLRRAGYRILDRNVRLGRYEVDIIVQKGDTIAFVEVKTRKSDDMVSPEANVTQKKQRHLRRAAEIFMAREKDAATNYRFDVVSVVIPREGKPEIRILPNAF